MNFLATIFVMGGVNLFISDCMWINSLTSKIPSWIQRFLLPELESIKGGLKAINARIGELDKRVESLRNEMTARFEAVNSRIDSLGKRFDVAERLAVIEAKLREHDETLKKIV